VQDVFTALAHLAESGGQFDLILADPPYGEKNIGRRSTSFAQQILDDATLPKVLAPEGRFILGHARRDSLEIPSAWREIKLLKHGVQQNILVAQGAVTTVIALLYAFIPDVSSAYWILSVITTQVYLVVYLLMFIAAVKLRKKYPNHPRGFKVPALMLVCVVGWLASLAAMAIGFVPSSQFGGSGTLTYVLIVGSGLVIVGLLIPFLFYKFRKPSWKTANPATTEAIE
jgi:amino acid transporter